MNPTIGLYKKDPIDIDIMPKIISTSIKLITDDIFSIIN